MFQFLIARVNTYPEYFFFFFYVHVSVVDRKLRGLQLSTKEWYKETCDCRFLQSGCEVSQ